MNEEDYKIMIRRFRGFYPVVVDVETGGFDCKKDALLEIGVVTLKIDEHGWMKPHNEFHCHVNPFEGANMDPASLEVNGIDPHHPFRIAAAKDEETAIRDMFRFISKEMKQHKCKRAIMIGHNTTLDHDFIFAAAERNKISRNPFHPFSTFDTVRLSALAYGQTVLSRAAQAAGLPWDTSEAHSALYDAKQTAELFCIISNSWTESRGPVWSDENTV